VQQPVAFGIQKSGRVAKRGEFYACIIRIKDDTKTETQPTATAK
jgi:hypothetical protein